MENRNSWTKTYNGCLAVSFRIRNLFYSGNTLLPSWGKEGTHNDLAITMRQLENLTREGTARPVRRVQRCDHVRVHDVLLGVQVILHLIPLKNLKIRQPQIVCGVAADRGDLRRITGRRRDASCTDVDHATRSPNNCKFMENEITVATETHLCKPKCKPG
jgi:hypothetical protein